MDIGSKYRHYGRPDFINTIGEHPMSDLRPAQLAGQTSFKCVMAGDRAGWLALFAEDALVQDPVGKSPLDPSGEGRKGKAAIAEFWDTVISAGGQKEFTIRESYPAGNQVANVVTMLNDLGGGLKATVNMVAVYEVDNEGKVKSLKAYWDYNKMEADVVKLMEQAQG